MAIPGNTLSTAVHSDDFRGGRASPKLSITKDFETGPTELNDTSAGLLVKTWVFEILADTLVVYPEATPSQKTTISSGHGELTEISGTFDQNGRPIVAYVEDGSAKLRWFDPVPATFVVTDYGLTVLNPRVALDDKRFLQNAASDIIFSYILNGGLYIRVQRERYLTARLLDANAILSTETQKILFRTGLNRGYRFQWEFRDYDIDESFEFVLTNENQEAFLDLAKDDAGVRDDINDNSSTTTNFDLGDATVWDADNSADGE